MSHTDYHCLTTVNTKVCFPPSVLSYKKGKKKKKMLEFIYMYPQHCGNPLQLANRTGSCTHSAVFFKEAVTWLLEGGDGKLSQLKNVAAALHLELLQI